MNLPLVKGGTTMTPDLRQRVAREGQEGMALVLAIMVLLVLTVIGAALMANVNTETRIAGLKVRDTQALSTAEAGVQEAMLRIRNGDIVDDVNAAKTTYIFNQVAGSVPPVGTNEVGLATLQPAGSWLSYSTATKTPYTLSVRYKTRGTPGQILKYDDAANPKINTATGNPIWVITSTGTQGTASRTVYAEVTRSKFNVLARAAVAANVGIDFKGNINVCGHDHRMDTPLNTLPPACCASWHMIPTTSHTTCLPGAWSSNIVQKQGSSTVQGDPVPWRSSQPTASFYSGPWDMLGMSQSEFYAWVGTPTNSEPSPPVGIYYLDNNIIKQDHVGDWHYTGGDGEGFLYCDGNLHINGNFTFKGLIYCEGDLDINGNVWILGGLVVRGNSTVKIANGTATILFSGDAIQQKISRYGGNLRTIAWRELN